MEAIGFHFQRDGGADSRVEVLRFGGEDVVGGAGGVIEAWARVEVGGLLWSWSRSCWAWGWVPVVRVGVVGIVRDEVELAEALFRAVVKTKSGVGDIFGVEEGVAVGVEGLRGGDKADAWGSVPEEGGLVDGRRGGQGKSLRDAVVVVVAKFVEDGGAGVAGAGAEDLDLDEAAVLGDGLAFLTGEEEEAALLDAGHSIVERAGQPKGERDSALCVGDGVDAPGYDLAAVDVNFEEKVSTW